jgi:serine/threonine protein phosphatase PrpC
MTFPVSTKIEVKPEVKSEVEIAEDLTAHADLPMVQADAEEQLSGISEINFPEFVELESPYIDDLVSPNLDSNADAPLIQLTLTYPEYASNYLQEISYAAATDVGEQRDRNEDDFVTILQIMQLEGKSQISDRSFRGLFVVCDGMGGHEGGEIASKIAVNSIIDQFKPFWIDTLPGRTKLAEIIMKAHEAIYEQNEAHKKSSLGRMGTTLAMMSVHNHRVAIAHVGDSRIYQITGGGVEPQLQQVTRDHEVLNQLLDLGMPMDEAIARPDAHQLTQALGPNDSKSIEPEIQFLEMKASTLFLICSDGLSDHDLIEQNWRSHLLPILNQDIDLTTGLQNLMRLGNTVNGHDNLTAILVFCRFA